MSLSDKAGEIKNRIGIPEYFRVMILPEMPGYYLDYEVNFEYKPVVKCPLHGEDTPSFRYYDDTNSFYCFGCGAGGDIIQLHILAVYALSGAEIHYEEAVNFLYEKFINKRDHKNLTESLGLNKVHVSKESSVKHLSSTVELLRLYRYMVDLQNRLMTDEYDQWKKERLYKHMDNIKLLVDNNLIKASDALKFIIEQDRRVREQEEPTEQEGKDSYT